MKKILVVEDDQDICDIVEIVLSENYEVLIKQDGSHLVLTLSQFMPDLILIDNLIKAENAEEIIQEIKATGFDLKIPIILFSAHSDIETIAARIGAVAYIAKPFGLQAFQQCISQVLLSVSSQQFIPL